MSGWLGAMNYGVIVANDVDALLMKSDRPCGAAARRLATDVAPAAFRTAPSSTCHVPRSHPSRDSAPRRRFCSWTKSSSRRRDADRLPQDVSPATSISSPATIRSFRSCRACCCARRRCRPARCCCRSIVDPATGGVPVATRMNDVRFKRMVRPGETIEIEVSCTERLADAFFLDGQGDLSAANWPCRFEFACTAWRELSESSTVSHDRLPAARRQDDPGLRRGQPQERGLARRPRAGRGRRQGRLRRPHPPERQKAVANCSPERRRSTSATSSSRTRSRGCATSSPPPAGSSTAWCTRSPLPTTATGLKPFHETPKPAFLRAVDISCYSLIALSNALKDLLDRRRLGGDDLHLHDAHGQRELRLHGAGQGGARFVAGVSGQVVQPFSRDALQRRRPRAC